MHVYTFTDKFSLGRNFFFADKNIFVGINNFCPLNKRDQKIYFADMMMIMGKNTFIPMSVSWAKIYFLPISLIGVGSFVDIASTT